MLLLTKYLKSNYRQFIRNYMKRIIVDFSIFKLHRNYCFNKNSRSLLIKKSQHVYTTNGGGGPRSPLVFFSPLPSRYIGTRICDLVG